MSDTTPKETWHAFLASRIEGAEEFRERVWELGKRLSLPILVSEIAARGDRFDKNLDWIQVACLKEVRAAPVFLCVLHGSYGAVWNETKTSILELEIATAAFSRRDVWIFLVSPFNAAPEILSLLQTIEACCPDARIFAPMSEQKIIEAIERTLERADLSNEVVRVGALVQSFAIARSPMLNFSLNARDVQFLNGRFAPLSNNKPDKDLVARLIANAASETTVPYKLAMLWVAVRHLSSAPYTDLDNEEFLFLWEQVLGHWSSASAWYSLHGHFHLGRLAAINSLSSIRARMPEKIQLQVGPPTIFANMGAAASEYYSIAKLVPSPILRHWLLGKALWNCNVALENNKDKEKSGLFDIRGHIKLARFNPVGAISDLERSLAMRLESSQEQALVGESEVHLGRAYSVCRLFRRAERLLESGVMKLESSNNYPFRTQALKHLGQHYARIGRKSDAIHTLMRGRAIASAHEIQGQLAQIDDTLASLGVDSRTTNS